MKTSQISEKDLNNVREFVREKTGISISSDKTNALQNSLQIRFQALKHSNVSEYLKFIKYHPFGNDELKEFIKLITINKTDFFRYPPQFEALEKWVLPEFLNQGFHDIAIWSAGCSTGEEPYSIALSLLRTINSSNPVRAEILATDINEEALESARRGIYSIRKVKNIPRSLFNQHFHLLSKDKFEIASSVKKMVDFQYHNLANLDYPTPEKGSWDIIFCRNVSIYFDLEKTKTVLEKFFELISPGGYLFIGHSESLFNVFDKFSLVEKANIFIYRKEKEHPPKPLHSIPVPSLSPPLSPGSFNHISVPPPPLRERKSPLVQPEAKPKPPDLYQLALQKFDHQDYQQGLELLNKYIQENPQKPIPYITRGNIQTDLYQYEDAINSYQTAIEIDPLIAEVYLLLGIVCKKKGDHEDAVSFFKRALFVNDNISQAAFMLGLIYRDQGNFEQAVRELSYAIRSAAKITSDSPDPIQSYWCPDNRPILERNLLIKMSRENVKHIQNKLKNIDR